MTTSMYSWERITKNNHNFIVNTADLTLKQMFDISTRLVSEQDEISGLETIGWENHSCKYLSLIGDERVINLQRTNFYVFSDSVLCLGKIFENTQSNDAWEQRLGWLKSSSKNRNFDRIDGEPMEFQWNIFPGFITLQLSEEVKRLQRQRTRMPRKCQTRISVREKIWKRDNGHLLVLVRKRSGTVSVKAVHKEYGTILLKVCWWNSQKADVQCSALRAHCPEVNSKAKDMENCRYTMQPIWKRLRLFFA